MLKFFALLLLALHCNCQNVVEVRGNKVVQSYGSSLPLRTVSGLSGISGLSGLSGLSSYGLSGLSNYGHSGYGVSGLSALPVSSYVKSLPALNYGLNINGLDLGYLNSHRNAYGAAVNIAPSAYSYAAPHQSLLAIRQPNLQAISVAQPAAFAVAQPAAVAVARPALSHLAISQPAVHIARPQVFSQAVQSEQVHPVSAAIHQVGRTVEYRNVPHQEGPIVPQEVVVEPSDQPINIHFRSRSSTVRLSQEHIPGEAGSVEQTQSQDEPSKVSHEVVKPVIQEVREVIQPYRQVTQEVQPVVENVHRVVSAGEALRQHFVAEQPLVRQVQAVRQVQPLSYAVAQPAISVARPVGYAVGQPAISVAGPVGYAVAQRAVSVAQPLAYAQRAISYAQPIEYQRSAYAVQQPLQYQTVSVQQQQPIISSIVREPVIQRLAQPIIGYNRIVSDQQLPSISYQQDVREIRPEIRQEVRQVVREQTQDIQRGNDYIKYQESDD